MLALDDPPSLDGPWSIGEEAFRAILAGLKPGERRAIVEFGAGASTVAIARGCPHATILAIEHDAAHFDRVREWCDKYAPQAAVTLELRPLVWHVSVHGLFRSYRAGSMPEAIDAIIVDGPPHWTLRGREHCLYQTFSRLRIGGSVYLDDYRREPEQRMVENWLRAFPGAFSVSHIESGHRVCVLEKRREVCQRLPVRNLADNLLVHGQWAARRVLDRVRRALAGTRASSRP